jgi:hypothetical protein
MSYSTKQAVVMIGEMFYMMDPLNECNCIYMRDLTPKVYQDVHTLPSSRFKPITSKKETHVFRPIL